MAVIKSANKPTRSRTKGLPYPYCTAREVLSYAKLQINRVSSWPFTGPYTAKPVIAGVHN